MSNLRRVGVVFAVLFALVTEGRAETLGFSLSPDSRSETLTVSVLDEMTQTPITDAVVTQGETLTPTSMEFSNSSGIAQLDASRGRTITVSKVGYAAISLMGLQSSLVTIYLKPLITKAPEEIVGGRVGGWEVLKDEDFFPNSSDALTGKPVYAGLVMRGLSAIDLISFSMSTVISPLYDTIDVFGARNIPSNAVLPHEKIPFFLGSVTVEKYNYRLPITHGRTTRATVVQGQIDSGDLVKLATGGKITPAALNKFTFNRVGISAPFTATGPYSLDINGDLPLSAAHDVTVKAPPFPADVIVAALTDLDGDRQMLIPTDLKAPIVQDDFQSGAFPAGAATVSLRSTTAPQGKNRGVAAVATSRDLKRISGVIRPNETSTVAMGDFLNAPELKDMPSMPAKVAFSAPTQGLGLTVFESSVPLDDKRVRPYPIWFVYSFPSSGTVEIPTALLPVKDAVHSYAVMQMEFDSSFDERTIDGSAAIMGLTRFIRSSAKIGSRGPDVLE